MIFDFLKSHNIPYQLVDHPAVFTCEEAKRLVPHLPGAETKNLFLRDAKGRRHLLVVVPPDKSVDLKELGTLLQLNGLGFASSDRLQKHLGLEPGAVSLLGVINDSNAAVEVIIDQDLWKDEAFQCHPLVNTSTLSLSKDAVLKFLEITKHTPRILLLPSRASNL